MLLMVAHYLIHPARCNKHIKIVADHALLECILADGQAEWESLETVGTARHSKGSEVLTTLQ